MKKIIATSLIAAMVGGCATASKDITATYSSPVMYQAYDCQQIAAETARIQARVTQLGGRLDEAASHDKAIAGVGAIIFWPALFALGSTKAQEAEYANLKGQYDAIQMAAVEKKCSVAPATPARVASAT